MSSLTNIAQGFKGNTHRKSGQLEGHRPVSEVSLCRITSDQLNPADHLKKLMYLDFKSRDAGKISNIKFYITNEFSDLTNNIYILLFSSSSNTIFIHKL
jgi:hypothetical protein